MNAAINATIESVSEYSDVHGYLIGFTDYRTTHEETFIVVCRIEQYCPYSQLIINELKRALVLGLV